MLTSILPRCLHSTYTMRVHQLRRFGMAAGHARTDRRVWLTGALDRRPITVQNKTLKCCNPAKSQVIGGLPHVGKTTSKRALSSLSASTSCGTNAAEQTTDNGTIRDWPGLQAWRAFGIDRRRVWGKKGPEAQDGSASAGKPPSDSLAACARDILMTSDPREKIQKSHAAWAAFNAGELPLGSVPASTMPERPARPDLPKLVAPKLIPSPKNQPLPLNVYMLHNLAHIELNAIDLAWDTVARFSELGLPKDFYTDFAHVADDESRHLGWCLQRLEELGHAYGDMVAHDLLWEGAQTSSGDVGWRMCLVPMSQEARGLDAGPRLVQKMTGWGDNRSSGIVDRISEEEKAHVAVGVAWFSRICCALEQPPEQHFRSTMSRLCPELLNGFFNHEARAEVGLPQTWYDLSAWPQAAAKSVVASVGLVPGKPGRRVEPSAPPMDPPDKMSEEQLARLQTRLGQMLEMEAATVGAK